jgi:cytochrome P450
MAESGQAGWRGELDVGAFYRDHFSYADPREPYVRESAYPGFAERCPITHSDAHGGFWFVNGYDAVNASMRDWETFSSRPEKGLTSVVKGRLPRGPIDVDPPLQRAYRRILNPYLTPRALADMEPGIRLLSTELIDSFIQDGECDLAEQFARPFPGRMLYRFLLGIDEAEIPKVKAWSETVIFDVGHPEEREHSVELLNNWVAELVERRRREPARGDMVDGIINATVDGQPLEDREIMGCILILIEGGFSTTTDSILSTILRLAQNPELQERLRARPEDIPPSLDEFLRFDPPIPGIPRVVTRDCELAGAKIKAGERVYLNFHAANLDGSEFADADALKMGRSPNRHLSFGLGVHRCVGSSVARMNLRIALEELLSRLGPFHVTAGKSIERIPGPTWGPRTLPLTFDPSARRAVS